MATSDLQLSTGKSRYRIAAPLGEDTDRQLRAYALVAGAACVGVLGSAAMSSAQVIQPQLPPTSGYQSLAIDLNGDSLVDFTLYDFWSRSFQGSSTGIASRVLEVGGNTGAGVVGLKRHAAALTYGSVIGSSRSFQGASVQRVKMAKVSWFVCGSSCSSRFGTGEWLNVQNKYLGLKFAINGETHYGWARLSTSSTERPARIKARLTGFAYEATPNLPILAGEPGTTPTTGTTSGMTLGQLSLGSAGLPQEK